MTTAKRTPPVWWLAAAVAAAVLWGLWQGGSLVMKSQTRREVSSFGRSKTAATSSKAFIGICSSVKDDARWLREWIEFHKVVGINRFFIIDDGSTDGTREILQEYEREGTVVIIPGRVPEEGDPRCVQAAARDSAYVAMCFDHAAQHLDWMVIMDSDEYLYPRTSCSVPQYLNQTCNPTASHVVLQWEMFGSSGFSLHPNGLLTESFLTSGGDCSSYRDQWGPTCRTFGGNCKECRHMKYIANTGRCLKVAEHCNNHVPERLRLAVAGCDIEPDSVSSCLEWHQRYKEGNHQGFDASCCGAGLGFHHYSPKSEEARRWRSKRRMRNGLNEDRDATPGMDKRDLNWVLSPGILRFLPALRAAMKRRDPSTVVSHDVSFDSKCFFERGFRYMVREGTIDPPLLLYNKSSPEDCCAACTERTGCRLFTHRPSHDICALFHASSAAPTWPPHALPVFRSRTDGYISGAVVGNYC